MVTSWTLLIGKVSFHTEKVGYVSWEMEEQNP